ncbi:30S ribosomal protein S20 [Alphaproteobacteria bacterium]|nr:30S ribosomal protein S20 [Alphaproteobacteria bacterium]
MAQHKSSKKRIVQDIKKAAENGMVRARTRTAVKKFEKLAAVGGADLNVSFKAAESALARAAGKGLMHRNTAARKTSRLNRRVKAAAAS